MSGLQQFILYFSASSCMIKTYVYLVIVTTEYIQSLTFSPLSCHSAVLDCLVNMGYIQLVYCTQLFIAFKNFFFYLSNKCMDVILYSKVVKYCATYYFS